MVIILLENGRVRGGGSGKQGDKMRIRGRWQEMGRDRETAKWAET